jgi:serine/threonine protein kinase
MSNHLSKWKETTKQSFSRRPSVLVPQHGQSYERNSPTSPSKRGSVSTSSYASFEVEWPLKVFSKQYRVVRTLGRGAQGLVMSLQNVALPSRDVVAKFYVDNEANRDMVTNEIKVLKRLNWDGCKPFLLCYQENFRTSIATLGKLDNEARNAFSRLQKKDVLVVVYDYFLGKNTIPLSSLLEHLQDEGEDVEDEEDEDEEDGDERALLDNLLNPDAILDIIKTLFRAISFLHENGVAHLDLKPQNVIINTLSRRVQLIDFGLSCWENQCQPGGTLFYMAPELARSMGKGKISLQSAIAADAWSAGVILYQLVNDGELPFIDVEITTPYTVAHLEQENISQSECNLFDVEVNKMIDHAISLLLQVDTRERATLNQAVRMLSSPSIPSPRKW